MIPGVLREVSQRKTPSLPSLLPVSWLSPCMFDTDMFDMFDTTLVCEYVYKH